MSAQRVERVWCACQGLEFQFNGVVKAALTEKAAVGTGWKEARQ